MSTKPTFVFVPGAFHGPTCFDQIREYLTKAGYQSEAVATVSPNSEPPTTSHDADVEAITSVITPILDKGEDVILVMHSFGGTIGSEAAGKIHQTVPYSGTTGSGGKGKILRLIYVTAWVTFENEGSTNPSDIVKDFVPLYFEFKDGYFVLNDKAGDFYYGDTLTEEEKKKQIQALGKGIHPLSSFILPFTQTPWRYIPSTYIYSTVDQAAPYGMQTHLVERAKKEEVREGEVQPFSGELGEFYIDVPHCAMFVVPEHTEKLSTILVTIGEKS